MDVAPTNVLVLLLDDVGVDKVSAYGFPDAPPTPVIDGLAARGLRFRHAWAMPVCTPTRASLLTGRMPSRNGLGSVLYSKQPWELPLSEITIPEMLERTGDDWSTTAIGKWHLATVESPSGTRHPWLQGFDQFSGSMNNISGNPTMSEPGPRTYVAWEHVMFDGSQTIDRRFSTTALVDDALDALTRMKEPWFMYLAFHAAHQPLMAPPDGLVDTISLDPSDDGALYDANVRAADAEIGRLLRGLGPAYDRTLVFVIGDNGTPGRVKDESGMEGAKGTFLEGGVNVPFIVAGPPVTARGTTDALAHVVDVLPTIQDLVGVRDLGVTLDGVSLAPVFRDPAATPRDVLFTELLHPAGPPWRTADRAMSDGRLKLVVLGNGNRHVFREGAEEVEVSRAELTQAELAALGRLEAELARHPVTTTPVPRGERRKGR